MDKIQIRCTNRGKHIYISGVLEHLGNIVLFECFCVASGNRIVPPGFRSNLSCGKMIYILQIYKVASMTFEKSILRRETLLKGMKWFCGLYDIAGAQMKENSLILSFCVFFFMFLQFLITGDSFDHHVLWFFCK